jgi:hypothetical protein
MNQAPKPSLSLAAHSPKRGSCATSPVGDMFGSAQRWTFWYSFSASVRSFGTSARVVRHAYVPFIRQFGRAAIY